MTIAELAAKILDTIRAADTVKHAVIDPLAEQMYELLVAEGKIEPSEEGCLIEPQGAWEFDIVHLCVFRDEGAESWVGIFRNGEIEIYS